MSRPYTEVRYATDEEWREARTHGIGGSDVAAIMGINPWKSPLEVWLEKTGRAEPPDLSGNEKVEWGNRLEAAVADKFADAHPDMKVLRKNCTMVSKDRPWAFANIDREARGPSGRGGLECKTAGLRSEGQWVYGPPEHYLAQVQHYLSVTGWDWWWVAVLIGGQEYREYLIPRDDEDIAAIDAAVDRFWNSFVVPGVMPALTGGGGESNALLGMYPDGEGYVPVMDADLPILGERLALGIERKNLDARIKAIDNELRALIGGSKGIESESVRCTWVRSKTSKLDERRLKEERPEIYSEYEYVSERDGGLRFSPAKD